MPGISIITNFDVNANAPIDSRMVVSNSTDRNAIQYVYAGLRVYQLSDQRTYLWNGTTWSLDSGGNGIYGGSGSLVGNTNVSFGTMGNTANNLSNVFQFDTPNPSSTVRTSMASYFRRHTNASAPQQWQGVEFRHEYRVSDVALGVGVGPYISFNPSDTLSRRGGIAFGTGQINVGGSSTILERMRINTEGQVGIGTDDPKARLQIGKSTDYIIATDLINSSQSQISTNWWDNGGDDVFDLSKGSSKIIFDSDGSVGISLRSQNTSKSAFTQSLYVTHNEVRSINDISANSWDNSVNKNYQMVSMANFVNNTEHRYTKIQSENWYQLSSTAYDDVNKQLLITDDANNFEITVTASTDRYIKDIKILRNGQPRDVMPGTRINVRFKHSNTPSNSNNFYIKLAESESATSSNIRSSFSDEVFYGNTYSLRIEHYPNSPTEWAGDIITFTKSPTVVNGPSWDIVNVDRQKQIWNYLKTDSILIPREEWDFTGTNMGYTGPGNNPTAPIQIEQWWFYAKIIGNSVLVDYQFIVDIPTNGSVTRTLGIKPKPSNPLYGKTVKRSNFVPSLGFNGSGRGTEPFSTITDYRSFTGMTHGFELEIIRIDYATNQYVAFGTASWEKYLNGQFVMHLD